MRRNMIYGLGAAITAAAMMSVANPAKTATGAATPEPAIRKPPRLALPQSAPNDFGPVIDSTPESKRARRRRQAKQRKGAAHVRVD